MAKLTDEMNGQVDVLVANNAAVQKALPPFMLALAFASIEQDQKEHIRPDLSKAVNIASTVPLSHLDPFSRYKCAKMVEVEGFAILKASNAGDDMRGMTYGMCLMILKLAEEGRVDPESQAVLVSIDITEEAKEVPEWGKFEVASRYAEAMMKEAFAKGYFAASTN